jgi:ABC-type multidrug transport system fused ATPase/permease subunit
MALAAAFLRRPMLLVLDEATAKGGGVARGAVQVCLGVSEGVSEGVRAL